jgi:predicted secreted protein
MPWISFVAIYFVTWFLALFVMLPIGVRRNEDPETGHDAGAPERPYMWWKALGTTVIAFIVTGIIWLGIENQWISFRPY